MKTQMIKCALFTVIFLTMTDPLLGQAMIDRIAAIVGKEIITLSDVNLTVQSMAMQNKLDPKSDELRNRVLEGLINDKLILAQAIEDSVVVSNDEVTDRLDRQIKMLVQQAACCTSIFICRSSRSVTSSLETTTLSSIACARMSLSLINPSSTLFRNSSDLGSSLFCMAID